MLQYSFFQGSDLLWRNLRLLNFFSVFNGLYVIHLFK